MDLSIKPSKSRKADSKLTPAMKRGLIPSFNEPSCVIVGSVKSGKSTLLQNLVADNRFYGKFFNRKNRYLFSPTATFDLIANEMKIPRENRISENMIERLQELVDDQIEAVEEDPDRAKKILIVFDDLSSMKKLQRSKVFERTFTTNRHLNMMVFVAVHKFTSLTRLCRLQCGHVIIFPCSYSEMEAIAEEYTPPGLTKKDMIGLIKEATKKNEKISHPFLYINLTQPFSKRYRKTFNEMIIFQSD
jgi:hypothetical protein